MTLYLVTPSFNSATYLDKTIENIASQTLSGTLHDHGQDGFSMDGTVAIGDLDLYRHEMNRVISLKSRRIRMVRLVFSSRLLAPVARQFDGKFDFLNISLRERGRCLAAALGAKNWLSSIKSAFSTKKGSSG